jgi:hypothetical protein
LLGTYWYASPYLAVWQIRSAAQARDAQAFNSHVDYPKLRESIKVQFSALFSDAPGQNHGAESANPGFAFGKMLGLLVVNKFVDAVVTPETVMRAMRQGYLVPEVPKAGRARQPDTDKPADGQTDEQAGHAEHGASEDKPHLVFERQSVDKLLIYSEELKQAGQAGQDKLGFVFERSGFATWKLSAVVLPLASR